MSDKAPKDAALSSAEQTQKDSQRTVDLLGGKSAAPRSDDQAAKDRALLDEKIAAAAEAQRRAGLQGPKVPLNPPLGGPIGQQTDAQALQGPTKVPQQAAQPVRPTQNPVQTRTEPVPTPPVVPAVIDPAVDLDALFKVQKRGDLRPAMVVLDPKNDRHNLLRQSDMIEVGEYWEGAWVNWPDGTRTYPADASELPGHKLAARLTRHGAEMLRQFDEVP
jgi:hypothetical protein